MMGHHEPPREHLFMYVISLENRVRKDHPLRKVRGLIDFDCMYKEVEDTYGDNGNVSMPPPVPDHRDFLPCGGFGDGLRVFWCKMG